MSLDLFSISLDLQMLLKSVLLPGKLLLVLPLNPNSKD